MEGEYSTTAPTLLPVTNGIKYGDVALRVVGVEAKSRLVYLRDCPSEIPDHVINSFFSSFGEVHSVSRSEHEGIPGLFDDNRVVKMTITKDVPASVRVGGFDCRVWYHCHPSFCTTCNACPLNGLCRRCRQPGHVAKECRNVWDSARRPAPAELKEFAKCLLGE